MNPARLKLPPAYGYRQRVVRTRNVTYIPHSIHRFGYENTAQCFGLQVVPKRRQITINPRRVTSQQREDIYPKAEACSRVTASTPAADVCARVTATTPAADACLRVTATTPAADAWSCVPSPTPILHKVHSMDPQQRQGVWRSPRCSGY